MARRDTRASLGNITIRKWFFLIQGHARKLPIPVRTIIVGIDINGKGLVQAVTGEIQI